MWEATQTEVVNTFYTPDLELMNANKTPFQITYPSLALGLWNNTPQKPDW